MNTSTYPLYPPLAPPIPYPSDDDHSHEEVNEPYLRDIECVWHRFRHLVFFTRGETSITLGCTDLRIIGDVDKEMVPNLSVRRGVDDPASQAKLRKLFDAMSQRDRDITICTILPDGKETIMKWWSEKT